MDLFKNKRIRFLVGVLIIGMFIFVLAPSLKQVPGFRAVFKVVDKNQIDATPLFYTELEHDLPK